MEMYYVLTEAMYQSLGQAIVIYLTSRLVLLSFPQLPAASRYNLTYVSQTLIFLFFCLNLYTGIREWDQYEATSAMAAKVAEPVSVRFVSLRALIMSQAPLVGMVYFLGLGVQGVLMIQGLLRTRDLRSGETVQSKIWTDKLDAWCRKLNVRQQVSFVTGHKATVPFTAGFLKPVIYFPVTAFNNLTVEQAEAILLHELAHIKRNDYLFNLFQKAMEMVMFFNPVCWILGAEIRREREYCCDDLVIRYTSDPQAYAHGLFLLERQQTGLEPALAATGRNTNTLLERIKRITTMNNQRLTLKPGMYAILGFLAAGLSVAWIAPATESKVKQDASTTLAVPVPENIRLLKGPDVLMADTNPSQDSSKVKKYFKSPEWKQQQAEIKAESEKIRKHFESDDWKRHMAEVRKHSEELKKHFEGPEWKKHMTELQKHSEELKKQFDSPEWKKHQQMLAQHGEKMKKHFESPEWKAKMKDIENMGAELEKKFNSPEWKSKMKELELHGEELEKKFNSPEWKSKMKAIELNSQELEKKFNSPEWKEKMEKLELNGKELEKKFNSPEWKNKMKELELKGKELEKKFNSPEWKKKMEELEAESLKTEKETEI